MKIRQNKSLKSLRSPFDTKDLIQLFSSSVFTSLEFNHDYQYWLPLLGLYTGCRLEELCQLHISDVITDAAIPYFSIDDKHNNQHIKSDSSRRDIPIHHELVELGFIQFVNEKLAMQETMLFGYLKPQRSKYGHQPSKWFGKFKHAQKVSDSKKVFHSFRHTMVESLRQSRAYDYEIKAILGHSSGSITHDIYGSSATAIQLINDAIQKISFKEVTQRVKAWC
jgi:integrase